MASLSQLGTFTYNGVSVDGPSLLTQSIRSRPQLDTSGRVKSFTIHELVVRLYVTGRPTDRSVLAARRLLTTPGKPFRYEDKGFGPLTLNIAGSQDVLWGPQPREMGFRPLSGGNACEVIWAVSVAMVDADQGGAVLRAGGGGFDGLEINFAASYDVDDAGYTTRTLDVELKVPGARLGPGSSRLLLTADQYREQLTPPQVLGFRRLWGPWQIDRAKTQLTGQVIDEEMGPNAPPKWASHVEASHLVGSTATGLSTWTGSVSANYEIIKAAPPDAEPVRHFLGVVVKDRIGTTAQALGVGSRSILPLSLEMTEPEIYGRRKASFRFSYTFVRRLDQILTASGLWRPVPGSNWRDWHASMEAGPAHPRGYARMTLGPDDDAIYDPAGDALTPPIFRTGGGRVPDARNGPLVIAGTATPPGLRGNEEIIRSIPGVVPQAATSWVHYESWCWVEVDSATIPVKPLPTAAPKPRTPQQAWTDFFANPFAVGLPPNPFDALGPFLPATDPSAVGKPVGRIESGLEPQRRTPPTVYVFLRGQAIRHGFPIPIPSLTNFGGAVPILACRLDRGEGFGHGILRGSGVAQVYGATWNIRYHIPDPPAGFVAPVPPNPLLATS